MGLENCDTQRRKVEKILECKIETLTAEKLLRKIETKKRALKEITRNLEAYSQSNKEMLRFVKNIIAHRTDHKFKTLDDVYNKINSWLPGLFQS